MSEVKSVFLEVMGNYPINRVLDFMANFDEFDYSLTDIAKFSRVGYATLQLFWKDLEKANIVTQTRVVGKAKMYRLNKKNPVVKNFVSMYWSLVKKKNIEYIKNLKKKVIIKIL